MVPSCLAREGSEEARANRELASVLPRSRLLASWADRRGVSSPQNSPSGKRRDIKTGEQECELDLIPVRRCRRGGRWTWGRGSRRRRTPQAGGQRQRLGVQVSTRRTDVIKSYSVWADWMGPCAVRQLFKLVNRNKCVSVETDLDKVLRCALLPLSLCPIVLCPRRWWRIVIVKRLQEQFVERWVEGWW